MYRLRIDQLRRIAAEHGDTTKYAIHRTTGISQSSVYRILSGEQQPDLFSVLRFADAYDSTVEDLMERTDAECVSVPA